MRIFRFLSTAFMGLLIFPMLYYAPIDTPLWGYVLLISVWLLSCTKAWLITTIVILFVETLKGKYEQQTKI